MAADRVSSDVRSRMMAGIRGKNTRPELLLRSALHAQGIRFRLHRKDLPGKPDLVFPRYRAVLFVNGCFWHGHDCHLFRWPKTREDFWRDKIGKNVDRDTRNRSALLQLGWRFATVWECSMKGPQRISVDSIASSCVCWLKSQESQLEIAGNEE